MALWFFTKTPTPPKSRKTKTHKTGKTQFGKTHPHSISMRKNAVYIKKLHGSICGANKLGLSQKGKETHWLEDSSPKTEQGFGCFSLGTKQRRLKSKIKVNKPKGSLMVVWINKTKIKNERKKKVQLCWEFHSLLSNTNNYEKFIKAPSECEWQREREKVQGFAELWGTKAKAHKTTGLERERGGGKGGRTWKELWERCREILGTVKFDIWFCTHGNESVQHRISIQSLILDSNFSNVT